MAKLVALLMTGALVVGCSETISEKETVKHRSDGTKTVDRETVKEKPDGTIVREKETVRQ